MLALALAGCTAERVRDPFTATGELIALSGGDAGARRACVVCHGLGGEGDGELAPRLAGLPAGYLVKQLQDYADGRRAHPQMEAIAKALNGQERQAVAEYYGSLPWSPAEGAAVAEAQGRLIYHSGLAQAGAPACADCHGAEGQGTGLGNPPLAGQPPGYLAAQMTHWRESRRRNDPQGVMLGISRRLSPAQAAAVSRYAAQLRSTPAAAGGAGASGPAASP